MGNVTLSIGGREFLLACADGEEAHILRLGRLIDAKVTSSGAVGHTEPRMLLFAALMMADELHDLHQSQPEVAATSNSTSEPAFAPEFAEKLGRIATRIENLADLLETEAASA